MAEIVGFDSEGNAIHIGDIVKIGDVKSITSSRLGFNDDMISNANCTAIVVDIQDDMNVFRLSIDDGRWAWDPSTITKSSEYDDDGESFCITDVDFINFLNQ